MQIISDLYFLPPVAYFTKIQQCEAVLVDIEQNYQKGTYANKCHVLTANGPLLMTVPLRHGNLTKTKIKDVKIAYDMDWTRHHWQTIVSAYGSAPYFVYFENALKKIYTQKPKFLIDFNIELMTFCFNILKIDAKISTLGVSVPENYIDIRGLFFPKAPLLGLTKPYIQVFQDRFDFVDGLSILDLIFCEGKHGRGRF
jgi:WbqC-like protein family